MGGDIKMAIASLRLRVEKDIITLIHRSLRGRGQLNVSLGQEVTPELIIGSSTFSSGFRTINLGLLLSVSPADIRKYLKREEGQRIYRGELLALKPKSLFHGQKVV